MYISIQNKKKFLEIFSRGTSQKHIFFFILKAYIHCTTYIYIMSSKLELLNQRIIKCEAENAEIPDLRRKISEFDAERAELKRRIAEVLRMAEEERTRRNADNVKLRAENVEFRDRLTKVEQKQTLQSALTANDNSSNNSS